MGFVSILDFDVHLTHGDHLLHIEVKLELCLMDVIILLSVSAFELVENRIQFRFCFSFDRSKFFECRGTELGECSAGLVVRDRFITRVRKELQFIADNRRTVGLQFE